MRQVVETCARASDAGRVRAAFRPARMSMRVPALAHAQAMVNLTRALDLSPKDSQQIEGAILNLEREDNGEEEEEL